MSHLRIKREWFDISGGWVSSRVGSSNTLQCEPYLKTLKRMHVNTGHIADTPGYTDQNGPDGLYTRYPLKYFNKLEPFSHYDTDALLPRIHAVEFLGEPQYGGGRPVPPMQVWRQLAAYEPTRLPTTVTHSEERIWRFYAGLSDFPHFDAYRVTAPSPDQWSKYDRWSGKTIRWGRRWKPSARCAVRSANSIGRCPQRIGRKERMKAGRFTVGASEHRRPQMNSARRRITRWPAALPRSTGST